MDALDPNPDPVDARPTDGTAHWPDVRLLIKGLRARAGTPRPARDRRAVRPRGSAQ